MNDNDLEPDLRSQRGPREGGYTPTVLPVTLDKAPAPGSTPSRVGRAGLFVGVGLAGAAAVAVIAGILSGPGSGPEVGSGQADRAPLGMVQLARLDAGLVHRLRHRSRIHSYRTHPCAFGVANRRHRAARPLRAQERPHTAHQCHVPDRRGVAARGVCHPASRRPAHRTLSDGDRNSCPAAAHPDCADAHAVRQHEACQPLSAHSVKRHRAWPPHCGRLGPARLERISRRTFSRGLVHLRLRDHDLLYQRVAVPRHGLRSFHFVRGASLHLHVRDCAHRVPGHSRAPRHARPRHL